MVRFLVCIALLFGAGVSSLFALPPKTAVSFSAPGPRFAIADFDGDRRPDLATVQTGAVSSSESRYWIRVQLSSGTYQSFGVTAPIGGIQLVPRDINGDNFPDVIVSTVWLNRPVAILLNDGRGRFALVDPAAFPEAVRESQSSWGMEAPQFKDHAVLNLSRCTTSACEAPSGLALPPDLPDAPGYTSLRTHGLLLGLAPLGRAPPALIHPI